MDAEAAAGMKVKIGLRFYIFRPLWPFVYIAKFLGFGIGDPVVAEELQVRAESHCPAAPLESSVAAPPQRLASEANQFQVGVEHPKSDIVQLNRRACVEANPADP